MWHEVTLWFRGVEHRVLQGCVVLQAFVAALPLTGVINSYSYGPFGCDFSMTATGPGGRFFVIFRALQGQWFQQLIATSIRWIKSRWVFFLTRGHKMYRYLRCVEHKVVVSKIISIRDLHINFKMMSYFLYLNIFQIEKKFKTSKIYTALIPKLAMVILRLHCGPLNSG